MSFTKKSLGIEISRLKLFSDPKVHFEQYPTESEIASDILWEAALKNEIENKIVADFGAGTGILGIGCLLLGAKKVFFIEKDKEALKIAKDNYIKMAKEYYLSKSEVEFILCDINELSKNDPFKNINVDVVIQNPPFGVKNTHADKEFLREAFKTAPLIYSFHKTESKKFIEEFSKDNNYKIIEIKNYEFPLKQTMKYHTRKIKKIDVSCFKLVKKKS